MSMTCVMTGACDVTRSNCDVTFDWQPSKSDVTDKLTNLEQSKLVGLLSGARAQPGVNFELLSSGIF